jgi:hypothetical protein
LEGKEKEKGREGGREEGKRINLFPSGQTCQGVRAVEDPISVM